MGLFSFAESPQLQALLADIAPPSTRDASYALYFTMAFGIGSLWTIVYGLVIGAARRGGGRAGGVRSDGGDVHPGRARDHPDPRRGARARERGVRGDPALVTRSRTFVGAGRGELAASGRCPPCPLAYCRTTDDTTTEGPNRGADLDARILLVEDDPSIREVTAIGLRQAGFTVTTASDGQAGLDRFNAEPFDLVLLDVMMPRLDGLEVCRAIRRTSTVPVVMLTARADTIDVVVGPRSGRRRLRPQAVRGPRAGRARSRRAAKGAAEAKATRERLHLGTLAIDLAGRTVHATGLRSRSPGRSSTSSSSSPATPARF